jgi:cation transport ATPase
MAVSGQEFSVASWAADDILLSPNLPRIATAAWLRRHVLRVAEQGIWFGKGLSLVAIVFAAKRGRTRCVGGE